MLNVINILGNANVWNWPINGIRSIWGYLINWLRLIGTGIALIILVIIAIRYMTASSDPDRKSNLKKALPNYLVGAVIFIAATNILYYVTEFVTYVLS